MSAIHTTNACPACGAPTVHGRAECWSCGEPLADMTAAAAIPPPESYTRPCPQCGAACADYLSHCPSCGAPLGRATALLENVLGRRGVEELPDGTIRIRRDPMPRRTRLILGPLVVAVMAYLCYSFITAPSAHKILRDLEEARILTTLMFFLIVAHTAARAMFCDVVWDISADRLVIRTTFFWKRWKQQYTGATLHLKTHYNLRGRRRTSQIVRAAEGTTTLERVPLLWNWNIRALADYLSQVTGWPVRDEAQDWP